MSLLNKVTVVIPAYKPDEKLLSTLRGVINVGFTDIIVVDDGGGEKYAPIFDEVKAIPECTVLHHEINRGKGAALKTAFSYYIGNRKDSIGLVTADADGQHLPKDIRGCAEDMADSGSVVLGVRDFSQPHVPARSKAGNRFTSGFFKVFFGMKISDTQTGLRAIPRKYVEAISKVDGDRYEYETHMLFLIGKAKIPLSEHIIDTVYIDDNSSSHFRVVRDSIRIYKMVILFLLSSILCTAVDAAMLIGFNNVFEGSLPFFTAFLLTVLSARAVSGVINYLINYFVVFKREGGLCSILKYFALALSLIAVSGGIALAVDLIFSQVWLTCVIKVLISLLMFPIVFRLQHNFVFGGQKNNK